MRVTCRKQGIDPGCYGTGSYARTFLRKRLVRAFASALHGNALSCRVADLDWRLGRVYFLAFLNPSRRQPDPALTARLASPATVDETSTGLD